MFFAQELALGYTFSMGMEQFFKKTKDATVAGLVTLASVAMFGNLAEAQAPGDAVKIHASFDPVIYTPGKTVQTGIASNVSWESARKSFDNVLKLNPQQAASVGILTGGSNERNAIFTSNGLLSNGGMIVFWWDPNQGWHKEEFADRTQVHYNVGETRIFHDIWLEKN